MTLKDGMTIVYIILALILAAISFLLSYLLSMHFKKKKVEKVTRNEAKKKNSGILSNNEESVQMQTSGFPNKPIKISRDSHRSKSTIFNSSSRFIHY